MGVAAGAVSEAGRAPVSAAGAEEATNNNNHSISSSSSAGTTTLTDHLRRAVALSINSLVKVPGIAQKKTAQ